MLEDFVRTTQRVTGGVFRQDEDLVTLAHAHVGEIGMDSGGDVRRERPRCRRPDEKRLALSPFDRKAHVDAQVSDFLVSLTDLHLGEPGRAAGTPGHDVVSVIDPAILVTDLQEMPDRVVIFVRQGVVGVVPVHEISEALGLLGLDRRVGEDTLFALLDEPVDAVGLDVTLGREPQFPFHLDFDPQPLAVEAVLVALPVPEHRVETLVEVLVGAPPGMVYAHRIVGRDRAVHEGVALLAVRVPRDVLLHDAVVVPPAEDRTLECGEVDVPGRYRFEHLVHLRAIESSCAPMLRNTSRYRKPPPSA